MKPWTRIVRDERGVALPLALFALVMLTGLLLAFLTMAGMEPEMAANLNDVTRARYAADAGLEWAFDRVVNIGVVPLAGTPVAGSNPPQVWLTTPNTQIPLPGLNAAFGTYTVTVRNDDQPNDNRLTGLAPCNVPTGATDCGPTLPTATNDNNGAFIVTASGTYKGITRQIQVVLWRVNLVPIPGSYSAPGAQADLSFQNANFTIDGRDYEYKCTANCADPNPINRTYAYSAKADQSKMKYGIATGVGNQFNTPGQTYEQRAEINLDTAAKRNKVMGKSQVGGGFTTGLNSVAPDASMGGLVPGTFIDKNGNVVPSGSETDNNGNPIVTADPPQTPKKMNDFLTQLANFKSTTIYKSKIACMQNVSGIDVGIRMIANSDPLKANIVTIQSGPGADPACNMNKQIDLGTVDKPALVYFRGDLDPSSAFSGVRTEDGPGGQKKIKGAGILVVEDGDFRVTNTLDWDGIVIVTGRYVSSIFESGAKVNIYGATVANETKKCESGGGGCAGAASGTLWDGSFASANTVNLFFSQQNLDLVQQKLLSRMSTWREL